MKRNIFALVCAGFLLAFVCGNVNAQNTSTTGKTSLTANLQAVANTAVTNPNVLVVTGRIIDAKTKQPVTNARLNFEKFGTELMQATMDEKGNYAIALNKTELGDPVRVIFKIGGYKRFIVKNLDKSASHATVDIFLQPMSSDEKSDGNVSYTMTDNTVSTLVIKMD